MSEHKSEPPRYSDVLDNAVVALILAIELGYDWGEFVALAVSQAAYEAGGPIYALGRRPGSWESAKVLDLILATGDPREGAGAQDEVL